MDYKFSTWISNLEKSYGSRMAVNSGSSSLSYYELLNSSQQCAMILNSLGVKKGDRVALWAANGADWTVAFFGIVMSGGVAVLVNYGLSADNVSKDINTVQAEWAVIGSNKVSSIDDSLAKNAVEKGGVPSDHVIKLDYLWKMATDMSQPFDYFAFYDLDSSIGQNDVQLIMFSIGTKGANQKPVQLTPFSVLSNVDALSFLLDEDITDSLCDALPLFNSFGLMMLLTWLHKGKEIHLLPDINPQQVMDTVFANGITGIASVGSVYSGLIRLNDFEDKLSGLLKICIVGDSFTTPTEMMRFEYSLENGKFLIGYGHAECSAIISMCVGRDPLECRAFSVGRILPGTEVKIWRDGTGFLNPGEIGEIIVKGPNLMTGYLGLPKGDQPVDFDGWLHTGDLGLIDEYGLLELTGSMKDIIIRSGEEISPMEIENVLTENEFVREAKVFGAPHPIWGESIEACIIPENDSFDVEAIRKYTIGRLQYSKVPSHFFTYSEFPLNLNGRLDQNRLKADMLEKLRTLSVSSSLDAGVHLMSVKVTNREFIIPSVCDMVQGLIEMMNFGRKQMNRIRLAVEEMLTERISNAYDGDGDITLEAILMPEWLRIRFVDSGKLYRLNDINASISAKIILANVDAYSSVFNDSDLTGYNLDWQYPEKFDVNNFLRKAGR